MLHQTIGNYYLEAELGSGGFGRVYKGRHSILTEREVAVKILHSYINSAEEREQFLQEAHFLERLKHPHILHIFDVGLSEGFPYIVSEFASEGSLADLLKMNAPNPLPEDVAIGIITQVGDALLYAHQQQIIHRDLKPENILFNHGSAYLADFGIAITLATASVKNVTITGTPSYMAPEQFQGQVSRESDQYALASIAYQLVTGRQPFSAPDFFSMGFQHLSTPPTPPDHHNPNLSPHVGQAILKAMAKQRTDRYSSLQEFLQALNPNSVFPATVHSETHIAQARPTPVPAYNEDTRYRLEDESDLLTLPSMKNEAIRSQTPITPITPSAPITPILFAGLPNGTNPLQDPLTPAPVGFHESGKYAEAFKTQQSNSGAYIPVNPPTQLAGNTGYYTQRSTTSPHDTPGNAFPFTDKPFEIPDTPFETIQKRKPTRRLVARISFGLVACLVGILLFAAVSHANGNGPSGTRGLSFVTSTTATIPPTNKSSGSQPTAKGSTPHSVPGGTTRTTNSTTTGNSNTLTIGTTATSGSTTTSGPTATQGTSPTQSPSVTAIGNPTQAPTDTPVPTPTDTPVPTPTDTPVPTPTDTPIPTPTPTSSTPVGTTETVTANFTGGAYSVQTTNSYSGTVQITVSGVGQAYDVTCWSDAFFVYTDQSGTALANPFHDTTSPNWVMTIDGEHTDNFVATPGYNSSHDYTFTINAPGGVLYFGVDDNVTSDDTGAYTVTVTQE